MIQTLLKQLSIAAAVLLAAGSVGYAQETHLSEELTKQLLLKCLAEAYSVYNEAWVDGCSRLPGGLMAHGASCSLPRLLAELLKQRFEHGTKSLLPGKRGRAAAVELPNPFGKTG